MQRDKIRHYFDDLITSSLPRKSRSTIAADGIKQKIRSVESVPEDGRITIDLKTLIDSALDVLISYKDRNRDQRQGVVEHISGGDLS